MSANKYFPAKVNDISEVVKYMKQFICQLSPEVDSKTDNNAPVENKSTAKRDKNNEYYVLCEILKPQFLKVRYSKQDDSDIGRIIISPIRDRTRYDTKMAFQANGIVLDSDTWDVLSMPPPACNPKFDYKSVAKNMPNYKIYEIKDGTTITLYWYKNKWCFSSVNGYEVNEYKWFGEKTYEEAFKEVLAKCYPEFSYDKLNKKYCYSFGFRHHEFHPMRSDPEDVWYIQCYDTTELKEVEDDIGINKQMSIEVPEAKPEELFDSLRKHNNTSLATYLNSLIGSSKRTVKYSNLLSVIVNNKNIHYGYIFRGDFEKCGKFSNIIIESDLLTKIRQFMYNLPKNNTKIHLDNTNRVKYCILRAYLTYNARETFIRLFPQYHEEYLKYDSLIDNLVKKILSTFRRKNKKSDKPSKLDNIASIFMGKFQNQMKIHPYEKGSEEIIRDYICHQYYTDIYYKILYEQ